jgi:hypothetical protein
MSDLDDYFQTELDGAYGVSVDLDNDVAYVAGQRDDAIVSINISNPSSMSGLDTLISAADTDGVRSVAIDIANSVLYFTAGNVKKFGAIDISNPSSLTILDSVSITATSFVGGLALNIDGPAATNAYD